MKIIYIITSIISFALIGILLLYNYIKKLFVYEIEFKAFGVIRTKEGDFKFPFKDSNEKIKIFGKSKDIVLKKFERMTKSKHVFYEIISMEFLGTIINYKDNE